MGTLNCEWHVFAPLRTKAAQADVADAKTILFPLERSCAMRVLRRYDFPDPALAEIMNSKSNSRAFSY